MTLAQHAAARRFPFSAKKGFILGDGPYYLVSKCRPNAWRVYLFQTAAARDVKFAEWGGYHCGASDRCSNDHSIGELEIRFHG